MNVKEDDDITKEKPLSSKSNQSPPMVKEEVTSMNKQGSVNLSHPGKLLYAEDNISKQDIYDYYDFICPYMMPYIQNRALALVRCPSIWMIIYTQYEPSKKVDSFTNRSMGRFLADKTRVTLRAITIEGNVISAQAEIYPFKLTVAHNDHGLSAYADNDKWCTQPRNKPLSHQRSVVTKNHSCQ